MASFPQSPPIFSSRQSSHSTRNLKATQRTFPSSLTEDVISNLLGDASSHSSPYAPTHSRSSSASTSTSRLSRYSGDAEDEGEDGPAGSDGYSGYSRSSTVLDGDMDAIVLPAVSNGPSLLPLPYILNKDPIGGVAAIMGVNGDVTPRAALRVPFCNGKLFCKLPFRGCLT